MVGSMMDSVASSVMDIGIRRAMGSVMGDG